MKKYLDKRLVKFNSTYFYLFFTYLVPTQFSLSSNNQPHSRLENPSKNLDLIIIIYLFLF